LSLLREGLRPWRIWLVLSLAAGLCLASLYYFSYKKEYREAKQTKTSAEIIREAIEEDEADKAAEASGTKEEAAGAGEGEGYDTYAISEGGKLSENASIKEIMAAVAEINAATGEGLSISDYAETIEKCESQLKAAKAYYDSSILADIDPYHVVETRVQAFVSGWEDEAERNLIIARYYEFMRSGISYGEAAKELGTEEIYIKETVTVSADYNAGTLNFTAVHYDADAEEKIVEAAIEQLKQAQEAIAEETAPHALEIKSGEPQVVVRSGSAYGATGLSTISSIQSTIDSYKSILNNKLVSLIAEKTGVEVSADEIPTLLTEDEKSTLPKLNKKKLLLAGAGGAVGAFIALTALWGLAALFTGKIVDSDELFETAGVTTLAQQSTKKRGAELRGIDKLIDRIGRGDEIKGSDSEKMKAAADYLRRNASGFKKVLVTGDVGREAAERAAEGLSEAFGGAEVSAAGWTAKDTEGLGAVSGCDAVVVAVEMGKSRFGRTFSEIEFARSQGKSVIGAIYL